MPCIDLREDRRAIREVQTGEVASTTRMFSMAVSSLAHAHVKPRELITEYIPGYDCEQGVSLQALSMPREVLECVSELRHLELRLETKDNLYISQSSTMHIVLQRGMAADNSFEIQKLSIRMRPHSYHDALSFVSYSSVFGTTGMIPNASSRTLRLESRYQNCTF